MELGEDKDLKFMMACADYIPPLQAFQGSCKPVWLFVAAGQGTTANFRGPTPGGPWVHKGYLILGTLQINPANYSLITAKWL